MIDHIQLQITGAIYYLLTVERQITCWNSECSKEKASANVTSNATCDLKYLNCDYTDSIDYQNWANSTGVFSNCNAGNQNITFNYGIFGPALKDGAVSTNFLEKYFYCLWWGLQQLRCESFYIYAFQKHDLSKSNSEIIVQQ